MILYNLRYIPPHLICVLYCTTQNKTYSKPEKRNIANNNAAHRKQQFTRVLAIVIENDRPITARELFEQIIVATVDEVDEIMAYCITEIYPTMRCLWDAYEEYGRGEQQATKVAKEKLMIHETAKTIPKGISLAIWQYFRLE